ncbi:hypothetical protein [Nonomuraea turkmeniaca]|nr:hypothetical protein [Nonomuraea turkmeniaca]
MRLTLSWANYFTDAERGALELVETVLTPNPSGSVSDPASLPSMGRCRP